MYLSDVWWPKSTLLPTDSDISPSEPTRLLSDRQWAAVADLFPWNPHNGRGGRPQVAPRECLEGILWVVLNGGRWNQIPDRFPSRSTCRRRFRSWSKNGCFEEAWERLLVTLDPVERSRWESARERSIGQSPAQRPTEFDRLNRGQSPLQHAFAAHFAFRPDAKLIGSDA